MDRTRLAAGLAAGLLATGALPAAADDGTVTLMTHDSFWLPDGVFEAFEAEHAVKVRLLPSGDAGAMVNQAILTVDAPLADVLFGVDNTAVDQLDGRGAKPRRRVVARSARRAASLFSVHEVKR